MKKILSTIMAVCLVFGCVFALSACATKLSGTYESSGVSYTFTAGGDVTIKTSIGVISGTVEGKYEINEDGDKITITIGSDEGSKFSGEHSFNKGKDNDGEYIKIDGITYRKAK